MSKSHTDDFACSAAGSSSTPPKNPKTAEIWVQPKEKFMNLLKTVGANSLKYTAQEVMSLLIKYISSRRLFDQNDPKKVYCSDDPLGDVFGVKMFTIQDARRLLFENLTLLDVPKKNNALPGQNPSYNYTLFQQSIMHQKQKPLSLDSKMAGLSAASRLATKRHRKTSSSSTTPSSVQSKRPKHRRKRRPKPKRRKDATDGTTFKAGEGSTSTAVILTSGPLGKDCPGAPGASRRQPWYCIVYTSSEDLQSKSSEVLSIQDNETIEAHDSSDDLWFLDEDTFAVEFEVSSTSSSEVVTSMGGTSDGAEASSKDEELIFDLKMLDSSDSRLGDYSSVDSDEELDEADKWRCTECNAKNTPICRYCLRCMAVRNAWLPDEQRMTLWERLHHRQGYPMKRAQSAPATELPQCLSRNTQIQSNTPSPPGVSPLTQRSPVVDVSDGRTAPTAEPKCLPSTSPVPQHPPTPCSSLPQVGTPLMRLSPGERLSPGKNSGGSGENSSCQDEAGHSSDSSCLHPAVGTVQVHGPGSQKTLSPLADDFGFSQSPVKRALSAAREDSGLGQSLRTMSSQGTTTMGNIHSGLPTSQKNTEDIGPAPKRARSEMIHTPLLSSQGAIGKSLNRTSGLTSPAAGVGQPCSTAAFESHHPSLAPSYVHGSLTDEQLESVGQNPIAHHTLTSQGPIDTNPQGLSISHLQGYAGSYTHGATVINPQGPGISHTLGHTLSSHEPTASGLLQPSISHHVNKNAQWPTISHNLGPAAGHTMGPAVSHTLGPTLSIPELSGLLQRPRSHHINMNVQGLAARHDQVPAFTHAQGPAISHTQDPAISYTQAATLTSHEPLASGQQRSSSHHINMNVQGLAARHDQVPAFTHVQGPAISQTQGPAISYTQEATLTSHEPLASGQQRSSSHHINMNVQGLAARHDQVPAFTHVQGPAISQTQGPAISYTQEATLTSHEPLASGQQRSSSHHINMNAQELAINQAPGSSVIQTQGPGISHTLGPTASIHEPTTASGPLQRSRSHHVSKRAHDRQAGQPSVPRSSTFHAGQSSSERTPAPETEQQPPSLSPCMVCMTRPRTYSIIHGQTGHHVCCRQCVKKLQKKGKPCPVCRKPIEKVIRIYW